MDRPVAMEVLSEDRQHDETARQEFVATARAKAAVQHPHILSVYEADQAGERFLLYPRVCRWITPSPSSPAAARA